jgi:ABC-type transport system substrate-binding protein
VAQLPQVEGQADSKLIPSGLFFQWWQPQMYTGPLADKAVRKALAWAFDRGKVNEIAWGGKAIDTWNPFDQSPYFNGATLDVAYDPERAKSELAAAGAANLELNICSISEPGPWKRESQVLQQGFEGAGIKATIESLPGNQWFDKLYTKRTHEGIAVNAGTVPFPWALIANYMMQATLPPLKEGEPSASPATWDAYQRAFAPEDEASYAQALADVQTNMLEDMTVYHTMVANNQNVAPATLEGVESTKIGDQRFDGAYFPA